MGKQKKSPVPKKAIKETASPKKVSEASKKKAEELAKKKEAQKKKKKAQRLNEIKKSVYYRNKKDGSGYSYEERWKKLEEIFAEHAYKFSRTAPNRVIVFDEDEKLELVTTAMHNALTERYEGFKATLEGDDIDSDDAELGLDHDSDKEVSNAHAEAGDY